MINELNGDIWKQHELGYWIVIPTNGYVKTNGQAVMGRGLAREAAMKFSTLPKKLGFKLKRSGNHVHTFPEIRVFTFPVKHTWDQPADLDLIEQSCEELEGIVYEYAGARLLWDVYMPRVGCGNGKLYWRDVKPVLERTLNNDKFVIMDRKTA